MNSINLRTFSEIGIENHNCRASFTCDYIHCSNNKFCEDCSLYISFIEDNICLECLYCDILCGEIIYCNTCYNLVPIYENCIEHHHDIIVYHDKIIKTISKMIDIQLKNE